MKKILIIGFFSLVSSIISAQSSLLILTNEKVIGKNFIANSDFLAREYNFPERIENSYIDTVTNLLTVQLRGITKNGKWLNSTGDMVLYDLSSKTINWSKKLNYQQSSIEQFENIIIQTIANKSYCLNIENGENKWEVKNTIYYTDPFQKIGIGYKFKSSTGYTNTLEGIDLTNGNSIWKREVNREYSWNDVFHLNDSVLVVVAAGLHAIDLKHGTGWDYNTITGEKDYTSTAITNAAGVALGLLTGTFMMATGHNLVRDVVSNVLVDSSSIYFASKEKISRLDHNGQIWWTYVLPKDLTSKSSIFIKDSLLYLINEGYAFMGNRQLDYGMPFIAAFNKNTGKQIFLNTINIKKDQINGFKIKNDTIYLIFKDRISKYNLNNGSIISEKSFDLETVGELWYFVGRQVYFKSDSLFNSLEALDSTKHYLFTKSGKILTINDDLEILNQVNYHQLYLYYLKTKNYKFLANENVTTVIDNSNIKVAELKASSKARLIGSKLYDMQERSFIEIDLNELINK